MYLSLPYKCNGAQGKEVSITNKISDEGREPAEPERIRETIIQVDVQKGWYAKCNIS